MVRLNDKKKKSPPHKVIEVSRNIGIRYRLNEHLWSALCLLSGFQVFSYRLTIDRADADIGLSVIVHVHMEVTVEH